MPYAIGSTSGKPFPSVLTLDAPPPRKRPRTDQLALRPAETAQAFAKGSELRALLFEWGGQPEAATEAELASPVAEDDSGAGAGAGAGAAAGAGAGNQNRCLIDSFKRSRAITQLINSLA